MRYGFVMPFGTAGAFADAARRAEDAGWDAIFAWEPVWGTDAWVCLTAAAAATTRIRLGTMLTPLPRIRPWDLAGRAATLDEFSGGRVQLAAGLGALHEGWTAFERDAGRAERALLLDEGLAVYDGLMRGQPFAFAGQRYDVRPTTFPPPPPPVQRPRVPVWVVGVVGRARSMRRAARWDGLLPAVPGPGGVRGPASPAEVAGAVAQARALRDEAGLPWAGYEVVVEGGTPAGDAPAGAERVQTFADAGATFWVEAMWDAARDAAGLARVLARIESGPPRG